MLACCTARTVSTGHTACCGSGAGTAFACGCGCAVDAGTVLPCLGLSGWIAADDSLVMFVIGSSGTSSSLLCSLPLPVFRGSLLTRNAAKPVIVQISQSRVRPRESTRHSGERVQSGSPNNVIVLQRLRQEEKVHIGADGKWKKGLERSLCCASCKKTHAETTRDPKPDFGSGLHAEEAKKNRQPTAHAHSQEPRSLDGNAKARRGNTTRTVNSQTLIFGCSVMAGVHGRCWGTQFQRIMDMKTMLA